MVYKNMNFLDSPLPIFCVIVKINGAKLGEFIKLYIYFIDILPFKISCFLNDYGILVFQFFHWCIDKRGEKTSLRLTVDIIWR